MPSALPAAVAGLVGGWMAWQSVAIVGDGDGRGGLAELAARWDLAGPVLIVVASAWMWRRSTATLVRLLGVLWISWVIVATLMTSLNPAPRRGHRLVSVLMFRSTVEPLPGLAPGVLLSTIVCAGVVIVGLRRFGNPARVPAAAIAIAIATSAVVAAIDATRWGWSSTIVGQLGFVAIGCAFGARDLPPAFHTASKQRRVVRAAAVAMPGLVLTGDGFAHLIARQYRERSVVVDGLTSLDGRLLPPLVWTICCCLAAGVAISAGWSLVGAFRSGTTLAWLHSSTAAAATVAAAFFVRLGGLLTVVPERTDAGDPLFYHTTANLLAAGRGFPEPLYWIAFQQQRPSAFHGPLYPMVLSFSSRFGGTSFFDHKMLSILIGTAVVAALVVLAGYVAGPLVAVVAATFAAIYPNLWLIDGLMYPEGLMTGLVLLCVIVAYRWRDHPRLISAAGLGSLIALAALARGEGVLLGGLLAMPLMLGAGDVPVSRRWTHLVVAGAACVAVLAPWTIRNSMRFEHFVPLSNNGNEVLVYSNCDTVFDGKLVGYWDFGCQQRVRDEIGEIPGDESEVALFWRDLGLDYARDNADQLPRVIALRVLRQFELFRPIQNVEFAVTEGRDRQAGLLGLGMYYGMALLGVVGVIDLRRRAKVVWPVLVPFVAVLVTAAYTYGTIRFRAPAEPMLCLLGGAGAVVVTRRLWAWAGRSPASAETPADATAWLAGGRIQWRRPSPSTLAGASIIAALVALPLRGLYRATGGNMEEPFMIVFPERLLAGDLPNRDFLHLYGPGALHVLAGWYTAFGFSLWSERTFGLLQHVALIAGLWVLARPWGRMVATAVASLSVFLVVTAVNLSAMAWNGGLALMVIAAGVALRAETLAAAGGSARRCWWVAGGLAGLALTYRPDLALAAGLLFGWMIWHRRSAWRPLVGGALVGLIPMWVHIALVGPSTALSGMFLDPVFELRAGRELPRPPSWSRLDGSLQAVAELIPPWWELPALAAEKSLFIWFFAMLAAPAALLLTARRIAPGLQRRTMTAVALVSLGIVPQALQRPDSTHLAWVSCVSFPFLIVALVELVRRRRPALAHRRVVMLAASAVTLGLGVVAPLFTFRSYLLHTRVGLGDVQAPFKVERNGRHFYLGDFFAAEASKQLIADLDDRFQPGDTLIVGPADLRRTWYSDVFFYYLFPELDPGTQFIEMDPGLANAPDSPLADELRVNDWVVLTRFWDGWHEPNSSIEFGNPEPNDVIRTQYCLIGSYENGLAELWQRCR